LPRAKYLAEKKSKIFAQKRGNSLAINRSAAAPTIAFRTLRVLQSIILAAQLVVMFKK
jgi:hypothetical protein